MDKKRAEQLELLGFAKDLSEELWQTKYEELVSFHRQHGHCLVPSSNRHLGKWVLRQRCLRKGPNCKIKGILTPDRINKLDKLGFVWNALEDKWSTMYSRLVEYKDRHGDCDVPMEYEPDKELATWVTWHRRLVRGSRSGELKEDRKKLLDNLGFIWVSTESWNKKYAKLVEYFNRHKHSKVPSYHKDLGSWISSLRKKRAEGQLSEEKEAKLNDLNFVWETDKERKERAWEESLQKLVEYKQKHGTLVVALSTPEGKTLNKWASRQRELEKAGTLRGDRKQKLDKIGFVWSNRTALVAPPLRAERNESDPVSNAGSKDDNSSKNKRKRLVRNETTTSASSREKTANSAAISKKGGKRKRMHPMGDVLAEVGLNSQGLAGGARKQKRRH
ncbi:helicase [Seminavis robusta]|uniref:Helicase n=1 Tax=Seminavis robusta TaxID=568900 RepID=A0A9N8HQZ8_9STRA|nr:helicase [Seminavis robusta]|eukprot:Sro1031_g233430.1 helicase (389) ;mRNA; r:21230-22396